jgi:hypothetical protein
VVAEVTSASYIVGGGVLGGHSVRDASPSDRIKAQLLMGLIDSGFDVIKVWVIMSFS